MGFKAPALPDPAAPVKVGRGLARSRAGVTAAGAMTIGRVRIEMLGDRVWLYVMGDDGVVLTPAQFERRLRTLINSADENE